MRTKQRDMLLMLWTVVMVTAGRLKAGRVVSGQTVCGGGAYCYKMAYFRDVSSRVSFTEARRACETEGGALLSISSQSEQSHVEHLLQELRSGAVGGAEGVADGDFWIGLTRDDEDQSHTFSSCPQRYFWTDGSTHTFRNWYFDEPSCGGEACVVLYHQPSALPGLGGAYLHQWNDDRCNMKHNFICKYQLESISLDENTPGGRSSHEPQEGRVTEPPGGDKAPSLVDRAGASGVLLIYIVLPTVPLLLLILVASGTCCFQTLHRRTPRSKTAGDQSNLWISNTPKHDNRMEV